MDSSAPVHISATLIVRNEAAHLRRCLASISPFVDELVVVDTGSDDDSASVAAQFGARVFHYPWHGDFSAARNHALDRATGNWILYIDADEQAQPVDGAALKGSLADPTVVAATVRFRNRTGVTRYREYRLFRNDPRVRFRNVIHETMVPDIFAVARSEGRQIAASPLALDHFGYDGNQEAKYRRNIPLLRARLAVDPEHVYSWNHLGEMLAGVGDRASAIEAWDHAIAIVRRRGVRDAIDALPYGSRLLSGPDRPSPALLAEARALFPDDLLFQWLEARQHVAAGRYRDAMPLLGPLSGIDANAFCSDSGVAYDAQIFGSATWELLALCCFQTGAYADAADWYARAAAAQPGRVELVAKQRLAEAKAGLLVQRP